MRNSRWSWLNLVKCGAWKEEFGACLKNYGPSKSIGVQIWWGEVGPSQQHVTVSRDQISNEKRMHPSINTNLKNNIIITINIILDSIIEYQSNMYRIKSPKGVRLFSHLSATRMLSLLLSSHFQFLAILLILLKKEILHQHLWNPNSKNLEKFSISAACQSNISQEAQEEWTLKVHPLNSRTHLFCRGQVWDIASTRPGLTCQHINLQAQSIRLMKPNRFVEIHN